MLQLVQGVPISRVRRYLENYTQYGQRIAI